MHDFRTGIFKNKRQKPGDLIKFFKNPTAPQLNFIHEVAMQHLGHSPSHFWGHQIVPWQFQGVAPEVFQYVADATRQPKHEFQRRMMDNHHLAKKGAGLISTIGRVLSDAAETGASLVNTGANFLKNHAGTIENAAHLTNVATGIGVLSGLISPGTGARVQAGTSYFKKKKPKGSGWSDYV